MKILNLKKIINFTNWPLIIFFTSILISLFLGDGKQPFIDLFAVVVIVFIYLYTYFRKEQKVQLPNRLNFVWIILIVYYLIRTVYSDSIGLSVSTSIRLIEAYLIFYFFYCYSKQSWTRLFTRGNLFFTYFAALIAMVLIFFPYYAGQLPGMNLLYASYGHNQLASLLIFTIPLILQPFLEKPSFFRFLLETFILIGIITTFARGAFIILLFYFIYLLVFHLKKRKTFPAFFLGSLTLFFILLLTAQFTLSGTKKLSFLPDWFEKQITKQFSFEGTRAPYWKQAWISFGKHPLFGSGPGTFSLLSKRYQEKPNSYSYFAHSFFLENLAETGIVGTSILLILFITLGKQIYTASIKSRNDSVEKYKKYDLPLIHGLVLTGIYSFIEFNLNFLVVWLLFWTTTALLSRNGPEQKKIKNSYNNLSLLLFLILIAIFYFLSTTSFILSDIPNANFRKFSFYLAPFDRYQTLKYVRFTNELNLPLNDFDLSLINFFHQKDGEVNYAIAQLAGKGNNLALAKKYFLNTLEFDSKNMTNHISYIKLLLNEKNTTALGEETERLSFIFLSNNLYLQTQSIDFKSPNLRENYLTIFNKLKDKAYEEDFLARLFYFLGLSVLEKDSQLTRLLWTISRDINPSLSFYSVELASLYANKLNDYTSAVLVLEQCLKNDYSRKHCQEIINNHLPSVGFYEKSILNFPLL